MPSEIRHVQIIDGKIATQSLNARDIRLQVESGTGTPPYTGSTYVSFPVVYGTSPYVDLQPVTTKAANVRWDIPRITVGSFVWQGTPSTRMRWRSVGVLP